MADTTTIAVAGILVSGVVGPAVAAWATRRANRQQFDRDQARRSRDDLRSIADTAAQTLALGATNMRLIRAAAVRGEQEAPELQQWASNVHMLEQQLLLRVSSTHPMTEAYRGVRNALIELGEQNVLEDTIAHFEDARSSFLARARESLSARIED